LKRFFEKKTVNRACVFVFFSRDRAGGDAPETDATRTDASVFSTGEAPIRRARRDGGGRRARVGVGG
jgi:hypothetical protein